MSKIKNKERILKAVREKQCVMYKGTYIKLSTDFSAEALPGKRKWHNIVKSDEMRRRGEKKQKASNQEPSTQQSYHSIQN